jgi:hypothetical protein
MEIYHVLILISLHGLESNGEKFVNHQKFNCTVCGTIVETPLASGALPRTVERLWTKYFDNQHVPYSHGVFPDGLEELYFSTYRPPLHPGVLPNSLKILDLGEWCNETIEDIANRKMFPRRPIMPNTFPDFC